jgi:hypothetical protein
MPAQPTVSHGLTALLLRNVILQPLLQLVLLVLV